MIKLGAAYQQRQRNLRTQRKAERQDRVDEIEANAVMHSV